jgi:hypothetical protein
MNGWRWIVAYFELSFLLRMALISDAFPKSPCTLQEPLQINSVSGGEILLSRFTFSSHLEWTDSPHSLQVFPCLLRPQIDDLHKIPIKDSFQVYNPQNTTHTLQYPQGVGMENDELLKEWGICDPSSPTTEIDRINTT